MRFKVRYERPEDLAAEHDAQMTKGGLLVRGEIPAGVQLFAAVELEIGGPFLRAPVVVAAQVVQVIEGIGVAVAFDPAPVAAALATARAAPAAPPRNEIADKIRIALHGNKDDRARILRDPNRMVHPYVLKNPQLGLDEVLAMAKMTTLSPEVLAQIAERAEWCQRPDIAIALVRNPKVPTPAAVRLVDYVSPTDLRQLAKDTRTRPAVQAAARRKVL